MAPGKSGLFTAQVVFFVNSVLFFCLQLLVDVVSLGMDELTSLNGRCNWAHLVPICNLEYSPS